MNPESKPVSPLVLRLATLAFPPAGLVLLWRNPGKTRSKIFGTVGIVLFSFLYTSLVIFLLIQFTGLEIEWRGGYMPAFTYRRTLPNYDALEQDRARHIARVPVATKYADHGANWEGFRGPHGDGIYSSSPILTNWPVSGLHLLWRQPIGGGYASFAIADGLAFTIEQRREKEVATAYDLESGREIWSYGWPALFSESMGGDGPRATPCYSDGKVYVLGAEGQLVSLEATTGKLFWSKNILTEHQAATPSYGVAASPLIVDEKLIVVTGAGHGQSVVCYNKQDGKLLWAALDDVTGYASPVFATLAGQAQLIVCCGKRTIALQPEDGKILWEYPWHVLTDQLPITQPVILSSNRFLLSAGYFTGSAVVQVDKNAAGLSTRTIWKNKNMKNKFASSVTCQGYVYGLDENVLTCLDASTGERKWKDGRYDYGQILLANGHLVILSGDGELALVKAAPERQVELARFQAIQGKTWNYPAICAGRLLVRNAAEMACFEISK